MHRLIPLALALGLGLVLGLGLLPAATAQDPAPPVDPDADALLRSMSRTLAAAKELSFRARMVEGVVDEATGKVVHLSSGRSIALARPGRLRVEETDTFARHVSWFDAGRLTILDTADNVVAVAEVPKTIDAMLDHLFEEHGLVMPIADLLYADPYAGLAPGIETGEHLGAATVSGRPCQHLAFTQEHLDWQIWIAEKDGRALPLRLVITYKEEPGDPQFTATFFDWDLETAHPRGRFDPELPADVKVITLEALIGADGGER